LLPKMYPNQFIQVIHTKMEGPLMAYQLGFEASKPYDVYFTQTDTYHPKLIGRDWLHEIVKLSKLPDCGFVSSLDAVKQSGETYFGIPYIGGWSMFVPRRIIQKFGVFDENFLVGDAVDIEYTYRVIREGFKIYVANFWVDHHRLTEHNNDRREDLEDIKIANRKYFREKYKGDFDELDRQKNTGNNVETKG
jgi:GT2 family glycosyltransferase